MCYNQISKLLKSIGEEKHDGHPVCTYMLVFRDVVIIVIIFVRTKKMFLYKVFIFSSPYRVVKSSGASGV